MKREIRRNHSSFGGPLCVSPRKGDVVEFYSSGGGGYGDPYERLVEAVVDDVDSGTALGGQGLRQSMVWSLTHKH